MWVCYPDINLPAPRRGARCPCEECPKHLKVVEKKYVTPLWRYEDGRIVYPVPYTALKRNGLQDQMLVESGVIRFMKKPTETAVWSEYPVSIPYARAGTCGVTTKGAF
ncbi:hypothetical protein EVAR_16352_1 [Eumeta japonica]|uniref:Uncharacterized protein n=1 Tax=Eumeta variegata TaxID=151549 RepID=A0A4C1VGL3_EUMVA|nr:hypothetical protein EVAR_16352_1 [Eumeta japonica]